MRVCFVNRFCHPDHSATSQLLSDLAVNLVSRGWTVTMVASRLRYDDPDARLLAREKWRGVDIVRIASTRFGRGNLAGRALDYLTFYLSLPWTLLLLLKRGDVVVAETDPPLVGLVVAPVAMVRGAVLVNWLQDVFPEVAVALGQPRIPSALAWLLRKLRNLSLKAAAMNVAIGERMAEYLLGQEIATAHVTVIPNWSHEDAIRPMPASDSRLRDRLGWQDQFVVGYSGNLGRAHDWETIFDAAVILESTPSVSFLIGGGGHGYDSLQRLVEKSGLKNIRFQPYHPMETLSDSMAAADLHLVSLRPELEGRIVPSKFYGIAAAERPIGFIGDSDGELARMIAASDCGFSVGSGQGELLAKSILALAADPQRCRAQGVKARQLLDENFSRDAAHQRWHDLLSSLGHE
jgi:glycosyltransferase involved in cell wall biosynthesis